MYWLQNNWTWTHTSVHVILTNKFNITKGIKTLYTLSRWIICIWFVWVSRGQCCTLWYDEGLVPLKLPYRVVKIISSSSMALQLCIPTELSRTSWELELVKKGGRPQNYNDFYFTLDFKNGLKDYKNCYNRLTLHVAKSTLLSSK